MVSKKAPEHEIGQLAQRNPLEKTGAGLSPAII